MAHRKKPTRESTGSSAKYAAAIKTWKAEHKGTKKSGGGGWKYAIPGVGPILASSDYNKIISGSHKKRTNNKKDSSSNTGITFSQAMKMGKGLKELGGKTYNLKNQEELTAYNKAKKASLSGKTNESSNRNKLSSKNNKSGKKGNNFKTTVHTRHYKTGERLGVMTRNQRRAYEKEAGDKTFESQVAKHEKESKHGKPHLRETKYKASLRKGGNKNSSSNKNRETLKTTQGKSMQSNPPGMRQKGVGKTANDLTRHLKKKKKKNLTTNEIKYPTYGTFRGL